MTGQRSKNRVFRRRRRFGRYWHVVSADERNVCRIPKVVTASLVVDGPFAETKEVVAGCLVIAAESNEPAIDVARGRPGVMRPGTSIEIREIATSG